MKTRQSASVAAILALGGSLAVQAAGYMKFDGVDGEAKSAPAPQGQPAAGQQRLQQAPQEPRGLLLPAVQKAREAPARPSASATEKTRGNVETEWKVEKGE